MNKYKGTKTEKNLQAAFAGESQARNKYTYFSSVAKKEGFEQISALFLKTAENEKEHAKMWLKELQGIGNTVENLKAAADGETKLIVAQRIGTIMDADKIIVLDDGKISGIGTHGDLLKNNAIYRDVYDSQMKSAEETGGRNNG